MKEKGNVKEIIGQNLRTLREAFGITQKEMAEKLDCTQAAIARYEAGITTPNENTLIAYSEYFNVTIDWIFGNRVIGKSDKTVKVRVKIPDFDDQLADALQPGSRTRAIIEEIIKDNKNK